MVYIQVIDMQVPEGQLNQLRQLVQDEYLVAIRDRSGFVRADLLEQVDDLNAVKLIIYWSDQRALENLHKTGVLAGSTQSIAARMQGLRIRKQSYIVKVSVDKNDTIAV